MAEENTQTTETTVPDSTTPESTPSSTTPAAEPKSTLDAISESLGYEKEGGTSEANVNSADAKGEKSPVDGKPPVDPKATAKPPVDPKAVKPAEDEKPPAGLSPDATRRFQTLVGEKKKLAAEVEELRPLKERVAQYEEQAEAIKRFSAVFEESQCKPEQFGQAMDVIKAFNSRNFDRVAEILQDQLRQLSLETGKDYLATDPLEMFPDLNQAVQAQQITRAHALELARGRKNEHVARQTEQRTQETQRAQQASERELEAGAAAVDKWLAEKSAKDIDFPVKHAKLTQELDWIAVNVPPGQWVAHLEKFYGLVGSVTAAAPAAKSFQPLRANGGSVGAKASPGSMLEAISNGLGYSA